MAKDAEETQTSKTQTEASATEQNPTSKEATVKSTDSRAKNTRKSTKTAKKSQRYADGAGFNAGMIALVLITLLLSAASATYCVWDYFNGNGNVTVNNYTGPDGNTASFIEGSIADVASKVAPGVVSILTEVTTTGMFGQTATGTAAGTGMIVTADGYILTNKHVVDGAKSVQVVLDDGTTYNKVEIVGTDPLNDVAFLKIRDVSNLPTVTLGDSKTLHAGQSVIAIGNALGQFQNTITSGIISGTGRSITATSSDYSSSENLTDMIQTDAAINSGNSGGPLVNAAGQVIGINTATSSDADGIGFAIPISSVKGMLNNIIKNNSADRAYIGVYYVTVTPDVAQTYNLPVSAGAYVYSPSQYSAIVSGGPADKAGLKDKDIITKVNGVNVGSTGSVSTLIGEYMPGDTVKLTILREGKEQTIDLKLEGYQSINSKK